MACHRTADVEIILSACRLALGNNETVVPTISTDQWNGVISAALDHGVIWPLEKLATRLDGLPGQLRSRIRAAAQAQTFQNLHFTDALIEILRVFRNRGIEAAVLKGPAVSLITAGKLASREFTDLDLLVRFEHLEIAKFALADLGYRQILEYKPVRRWTQRHKHITFIHDVEEVLVELHWVLNPPDLRFALEPTGIWNRMQTIRTHEESFWTLGLEDTLLYLCVHGARHGWESLKWVFDIAQLLQHRSMGVDWSALISRSQIAGCSRSLLIGIRLASDLFALREPDLPGRELTKDACARKVAERFRQSLLGNRPLSTLEIIGIQIQAHERLWDRVILACMLLIRRLRRTGADSTTWLPLWIITRPVRLFRSYGIGWLHSAILAR